MRSWMKVCRLAGDLVRGQGDEDESALASAPGQSGQRTAASKRPVPCHRGAAAQMTANQANAPPADSAPGCKGALGARSAQRAWRPAQLSQAGHRAAAATLDGGHPEKAADGRRPVRPPGSPYQHAEHRHPAEAPHAPRLRPLPLDLSGSHSDDANSGARIRCACRRAGAPVAGEDTAAVHGQKRRPTSLRRNW